MRIGIVDDHKLFRKSLVHLLNTFENVEVVLEAGNGNELKERLEETSLDLLLLDLQMPEVDGFESCAYVKEHFPDIKILIVSQLTSKESIHKVMELGANGFFTKNSDPLLLEHAIKSISEKDFFFGQELGFVLKEALLWEKKFKDMRTLDGVTISAREIEVIKFACQEYNSQEIADKLNINYRTVETHRKRIMEKTKSKNFIGSIIYVLKHGYLDIDKL